jgi:hypothetical protein
VSPSEQRSPWVWVGIAFVLAALASLATVVVFVVAGQRMVEKIRLQTNDPSRRLAAARQLLRARELPQGYRPVLAVPVPLLGRVAVLESSLERVGASGVVAPRELFLYLERDGFGEDAAAGEDLDRLLDVRGLTLEPGRLLEEGELDLGGQQLSYSALRARLKRPPQASWPVVAARIDVRCPAPDEISRLAVWLVLDPAPGRPLESAGTPADPEALGRLMESFALCGSAGLQSAP